MSSHWVYALIAGTSLATVACQPLDRDFDPVVGPPRPEAVERENRKLDERVARHQARWKARKEQFAAADR